MKAGLSSSSPRTAPFRTANPTSTSFLVWFGLIAYLALVKIVITLLPASFRSPEQSAVFGWPFIGLWMVTGLIGIYFASKTGFPAAVDERLSNQRQFLPPILLGLAFSLPFIAVDRLTHFTAWLAAQRGQPGINIDFPASVLIYSGGAVIVEVFYRLFLVPLLLWLISNVLLKRRGQEGIFWALALITSLIEPLTQDLDLAQLGVGVMLTVIGLNYSLNFAQAVLFRKYGFLAAILMRVAFYAIWHIVYVH